MPASPKNVRDQIIQILSRSSGGQPASDLVNKIVAQKVASLEDIRTNIRILLESGQIELGQNLNLVAKSGSIPRKKTG